MLGKTECLLTWHLAASAGMLRWKYFLDPLQPWISTTTGPELPAASYASCTPSLVLKCCVLEDMVCITPFVSVG